jgi:transporter family protein
MVMEYLWLVFALLSAIMAALVAIFGKLGLEGVDANTATAIRAVIMALFLIGVVVLLGKTGEIMTIFSNNTAMNWIILSGIAGALSWLFYFMALKLGNVTQVAPIDRLSVAFAVILAIIFLGETVSLTAGIGILLMVLGAIFLVLG